MKNASGNLTNGMNDSFPEEDEDDLYTDDLLDYCPPIKEVTALETTTKITALLVIIITSFIGNILIIIVTRRTRSLRKIAYSFVVNMAIADLLTTAINMPETLIVEIRNTDEWFPGDVGVVICKFLPFLQQVCAYCSVLSLLAISLDRYFAICLPLKRIMSKKLSTVIIFLTWLIPVVASAPMFVANNVVEEEGDILCVEDWPSPFDPVKAPNYYTIILFVLFYALPLTIISSLYTLVVLKIWRRRAPGNRSTVIAQVYSRSRKKALKMFISIVVCFTLCWLPYHVSFFLSSYVEFYLVCSLPRDIKFISLFFSHAISAINPCIYLIFNKDYRAGSKRQLSSSCCCVDSSVLHPADTTTAMAGNSRTDRIEEHEMKSFYIRSRRFWRKKIVPIQEDLISGRDSYVVQSNQDFASRDKT
ncbi:growth hormone secretagogue receptor type 1-like [Montipora capricornis]|uniref:growth hormone secretagogue receptor type 1-like n=1 Tax=Montipora capricornis TaxID=246305 RepID=UPI0035F17ECA